MRGMDAVELGITVHAHDLKTRSVICNKTNASIPRLSLYTSRMRRQVSVMDSSKLDREPARWAEKRSSIPQTAGYQREYEKSGKNLAIKAVRSWTRLTTVGEDGSTEINPRWYGPSRMTLNNLPVALNTAFTDSIAKQRRWYKCTTKRLTFVTYVYTTRLN